MAFVDTPNLALPGSAVKGDGAGTWVAQWNQLCANLEARLTKRGAGSPSGVVAGEYIGQVYYQTDSPVRWYCTAPGAAGVATWTSTAQFNHGVTIGGGNLTIASPLKLVAPTGESWLRQNSVDMNPHSHGAARHRYTGTEPWTSPLDILKYLINAFKPAVDATPAELTAAYAAKCPITLNTTGRTGNSTVLLLALVTMEKNDNNDGSASFHIARGTTPLSAEAFFSQGGNAAASQNSVLAWALDEACPSGATSTYQIRAIEILGNMQWIGGTLLLVDLGQTA